ncbi:unnamed protein product [Prorocentrum cordatum]|uniref:Uncharacterized protein n=1 Tax=Prorocentrum cordatum TaxID=2364126 RepID=A0ABN9WNI8_9DINO|nr:unnamed protein product [Polarella glacialis]
MKIGNKQNVKFTSKEGLTIFSRLFSGAPSGTARARILPGDGRLQWARGVQLSLLRVLPGLDGLGEGIPDHYKVMVENSTRPPTHKLNVAPSCASDKEQVQFVFGLTDSGLGDLAGSNPAKDVADLHCGPLSLYLRDPNITHIDVFSLGVGGAELLVLKTVDFSKVRIPVVMVESFGRGYQAIYPKRKAFRELVVSSGYRLDAGLGGA